MPAKRKYTRKSRNFANYVKGRAHETLAVGALGAASLVGDNFDQSVSTRTRISSLKAVWAMNAHTAGQGTVIVGVAHSDYTDAEIEESIEVLDSWDRGNKIDQERMKRKVRTVGVFAGVLAEESLNDGKPITTKLNWQLEIGQSLKLWAYNKTGTVFTTGTLIEVVGHVNLWLL